MEDDGKVCVWGGLDPWIGDHNEVKAFLENTRAGSIRGQRVGSLMSRFQR